MSLEEALNKNNALLEKHNDLLERLLTNTGGTAAAPTPKAAATEEKAEKPAAKKAEPKATTAATGPTYETVKAKASAWLGEHPRGSDEQAARRAYLESDLWPKLGITKLGELEGKDAELAKVDKWLDTKAKSDLFGYGDGIFAKPAAAADASTDEEEL